ncbi:IS4 family transposase [Methanoplanus limicola]|uniref:Transposase IS4 family protein n=1 Tax=Methanoplanus limicola DSM 2279 TaxID=937775 RepID=H1YXD2_9EURY|nr:IS4 family transposase [Methanoplanus limicola]EHQ36869.1 transposase IS4 family protein [Methanoplanus limicola DSM 2279]
MNHQQKDDNNSLRNWQEKLLPPEVIMEKARSTGFIKRMKKLDPTYLLYVLIFGISSHCKPTLEEIHRDYQDLGGKSAGTKEIRYQSFHNRFDSNMALFLRAMLDHYINITFADSPARLKGPVGILKDVLIQDSSIIRLSKKLAEEFPPARSRSEAAGLKIHAVYSAVSHSLKSFEITDEKTHDYKKIRIDGNIKDVLFLFDLGYYSHYVLANINERGGFFVSRVKNSAKPKLKEIVSESKIFDSFFEKGMNLGDFLDRIPKSGEIELICTFTGRDKEKPWGKKRINADFRVVCFWDENDKIWHNYVTNLPGDAYKKDEIYQLYRYRWIIELLFKEMKSDYDLGKFLLAREPLALIHVYSMLIRLVLSRNLYKKMVASLDEDEKPRYGPLLWSKVFAEKAHEFLSIIDQSIFGKESVGERWKKLGRFIAATCM